MDVLVWAFCAFGARITVIYVICSIFSTLNHGGCDSRHSMKEVLRFSGNLCFGKFPQSQNHQNKEKHGERAFLVWMMKFRKKN